MPLSFDKFSSQYVTDGQGTHTGFDAQSGLSSLWNLFTFWPNRAVQILEEMKTNEDYYGRKTTDQYITFKLYSGTQTHDDRNLTLSFSVNKSTVAYALSQAKLLDNGGQGVYFEHSVLKNSLADHPSMFMIGCIIGGGPSHGKWKIEMIFNKDDRLERLRIREEYKGERVLFSASRLRSEADIRREQKQIREANRLKNEEAHERNEENIRFKF